MRSFVPVVVLPALLACSQSVRPEGADDGPLSNATTAFTAVTPGARLLTTADVNLRRAPDSKAPIQHVIEEGTPVTVTTGALEGKWLEVELEGERGWLFAPYVSFEACLVLEQAAAHLRRALASCSGEGDENIYGFTRASCEAASSSCSLDEVESMLTVARCDVDTVPVCATSADRHLVVGAVHACAESVNSVISFECASALSE